MTVKNSPPLSYYRNGNSGSYHRRFITSSLVFLLTVHILSIDAKSLPMKLMFPNDSDESPSSSSALTTPSSTTTTTTETLSTSIAPRAVNETVKLCPENGTRYHNATQQCWKIKEKGPCSDTLIFSVVDKIYGDCECKLDEGFLNTVWVYNEKLDKCFKSYNQAYCKTGEWLIFSDDNDGEPTCVPNKCEKLQQEDPEKNKEHPVVLYNNTCVRLAQSMDTGNCSNSTDVLIIDHKTGKPECADFSSRNVGSVNGFKCRPGTRRDKLGKCRTVSKVTFPPS